MNRKTNHTLGILLLVALVGATVAPAARADRGRGHGGWSVHERGPRMVRPWRPGPVLIERHSDAGPALVGFLGGLVLGSMIAHVPPAAPPPPVYEYYDPFCRESFGSLEDYEAHLDRVDHPARIEVLDARSGRNLDTLRYRDGRWLGREDWGRDDRDRDETGGDASE